MSTQPDATTSQYLPELERLARTLETPVSSHDVEDVFTPFPAQAMDTKGNQGPYTVTIRLVRNASMRTAIDHGLDVAGRTLVELEEDYSAWKDHEKLHVITLGIPIDSDAIPDGEYVRNYALPDQIWLYIQVLRQYAKHRDGAAVGIVNWKHGIPSTAFGGVDPDRGKFPDLEPAWRAVRELGGIDKNRGGSPKGWRKGRRWDRDDFLGWYREASEGFASDGGRVTLSDLAEALGVRSETTAKARLDTVGLPWPPESFPDVWEEGW